MIFLFIHVSFHSKFSNTNRPQSWFSSKWLKFFIFDVDRLYCNFYISLLWNYRIMIYLSYSHLLFQFCTDDVHYRCSTCFQVKFMHFQLQGTSVLPVNSTLCADCHLQKTRSRRSASIVSFFTVCYSFYSCS